jgi:hypothetical protein
MKRLALLAALFLVPISVAGGVVVAQQATLIGYQTGCVSTANALRAALPQNKAAFDNFQRTCQILAADHDAGIAPPPPPPPPPPSTTPTPAPLPAPQTYNKGSRGQDAKYCVNGGAGGTDAAGYRYDSSGLEIDGRRSGNFVAGLRPSDESNGLGPCDPYLGFPPWPAASYNR